MTRALIVDDNLQNLYLLESILRGYKYEVVTARNGAEALDAAIIKQPDLIVSDILMPVMDGFELCRKWKADERLNRIPFIFYTATYTDPKDERFALSLGAERFIVKPQKPDVLIRIVHEVLEERQQKTPDASVRPREDEREILRQYNEVLFRKLEKKVLQLEVEIAERRQIEERINLANRKLTLMTDVTFQDIQNKVTALRGFVELSKNPENEQARLSFIEKEGTILESIHQLINNTKEYQQMGVDKSRWIALDQTVSVQFSRMSQKRKILLDDDLHDLEVYSDPLIERVFYNLIHNAINHGKTLTRISFSCRETPDGVVVFCEDNGVGIPPEQKAGIFERVVGGEGRFGLFFCHEFLDIAGMKIIETGVPGKGARFEISVPKGLYRFRPQ